MQYLLDTHILLWWLMTPEKLRAKAQRIISDKNNDIFISSASFWEMAIKQGIGRISLPHNLMEATAAEGFKLLPILPEECLGVADLPLIHSDPFDRLLVIQAKFHNLVIITRDAMIPEYPVITLDA